MAAVVKKCKCESVFQDKTYGVGQRVHNEGTKDAVCTVCGSKKSISFKKGK